MDGSDPTNKITNCINVNKIICRLFVKCSRGRGIMGTVMMTLTMPSCPTQYGKIQPHDDKEKICS